MAAVRQLLSINSIMFAAILIGIINNLVAAALFGLSRGMDAYFSALVIPNLIIALGVEYIGKNFLPLYSRLMEEDVDRADIFISTIINVAGVIGLSLTAILLLGAPYLFRLIVPGFEPDALRETTQMFAILATAITAMVVNVFHGYLLQYKEHYAANAIGDLLLPIAILLSLVGLSFMVREYALAIGFAVGQWLKFFFILPRAHYKYRMIMRFSDPYIKRVFLNTGILTVAGTIARIQPVLVRTFGSQLGEGAVSAISLAERICRPVRVTAFTGVRMMMLSKSSRLVARRETDAVGALYTEVLTAILMLTTPFALWLGLNVHLLVDLLLQRGKFDSDMSGLVAFALIGLIPTLVLMPVNTILSNSIYVMDRIIVPAVLGPLSTLLFAGTVYLTLEHLGILSITFGFSIPYIVTFPILAFFLHRYLDTFGFYVVVKKAIQYLLLSGLTIGAVDLIARYFGLSPILRATVDTVAGGAIYLAALTILRDRGILYTTSRISAAFRREGALEL